MGGKGRLSHAIFLFIKDKFVPVPKHHNLKMYGGWGRGTDEVPRFLLSILDVSDLSA